MTTKARKPPVQTPLGALIAAAMLEEGMTYGRVEAAGGPSRQTTWNLVKRSRMTRPPMEETIEQLTKALPSLSDEAIRQAIAASMGLGGTAPASDGWSALGRVLAEKATDEERDLVLAAARGMWDQLRKRRA